MATNTTGLDQVRELNIIYDRVKALLPILGHPRSLMIAKRGETWMAAVRKSGLVGLDVANVRKNLPIYCLDEQIASIDLFVATDGDLVVALHEPQRPEEWCVMYFGSPQLMVAQLPTLIKFRTKYTAELDSDVWHQMAVALRELLARHIRIYTFPHAQVQLLLASIDKALAAV